MKKLLIIALIAVVFNSQGQIPLSTTVGRDNFNDTVISQSQGFDIGYFGREINTDTVNVIMLVCDTTKEYGLNYFDVNHSVWWRFGLEVLEKYSDITDYSTLYNKDGMNDYLRIPLWKHLKYLDEIGYELPKGIIVWMSTKIK